MTLRARIAAAAGVAVALAVMVAAVSLYLAVRSELRGEVDSSLTARAQELARAPLPPDGTRAPKTAPGAASRGQARGVVGPEDFPNHIQPLPLGGPSGYAQFVAPDGTVHVPGGQGPPAAIALNATDEAIARHGKGRAFSDRNVKGTHLRVLTVGTGARGALLVARPLTEVDREMRRVLAILVIVGLAGIAIAAALGALVARAALAPIVRFTRRTETLSESLDTSQRLPSTGKDELARLAHSFNTTLDALEQSVAAQRNLIADASHELRTPIASLRANIQVLGEAERLPVQDQEGLRADIVSELDELTRLVGDVVELARGSEQRGTFVEVRLEEIVEAAAERTRRRADRPVETRLEPTIVNGEASRIERAVANLLDNASKWSPPNAPIEVSLQDGLLSVRDHGPGFAEADLPHVFDRFYRAPGARKQPGSGLGLAIVRQAAEAHSGRVDAENAPGGGACVRVSFGTAVRARSTAS